MRPILSPIQVAPPSLAKQAAAIRKTALAPEQLSVEDGRSPSARAPARRAPPSVRIFPDNTELLAGLIRGDSAAWTRMIDRFGPLVQHLVGSALGIDTDLPDVVQEVFMRVMERVHQLRDPPALRNWIAAIAVFTARGHIRKRRRGRWLRFFAPSELPEPASLSSCADERSLVASTYRILDVLPAQERVAFSLRFIGEMELTEVAAACGVSLATVKRRLRNATQKFLEQARRDPDLRERIERGEGRQRPVMPGTRSAAGTPPA